MSATGINFASGLGTGLDVATTVSQLIQSESAPMHLMQSQQQTLQQEQSIVSSLASLLSNLSSQANHLSDISGAFNTMTTSTSNPGVLTASADSTAAVGNHTIVVNSLASNSSWYTASESSASAAVNTGSFSLQIGSGSATTINVDSAHASLSGIASLINAAGVNATASVVSDSNGARLEIVSTASGSASDISVSADTVGLGFTKALTGVDASYSLDGVPLTSSSNTVTGALAGVTLTLNSAQPNTPASFSISPNTQSIQSSLQSFVNAYNSVMQSINSQYAVDPTINQAGVLSADSNLAVLQQQMLSLAGMAPGTGSANNLASIGIDMQNDGTLTIDQSKLTSALTGKFQDVKNMFQSTGGYGATLSADLTQMTDPTVGIMNADATGLQQQITDLGTSITNFQDYLNQEQQTLTDKYNQINVLLQDEPMQLAQVQSELGVKTTA